MNSTSFREDCFLWRPTHLNPTLYDSNTFYYIKRTILAINCLSSPVSAIGNGLVLIAMFRTPSLHTPANILIGSLALVDFIIGLVIQSMFTVFVMRRDLFLSCYYADSFTFIGFVCSCTSVSMMAAVSCERYTALFLPLRYTALVTNRRVAIIAFVILFYWCIAVTVMGFNNLVFVLFGGFAWFLSCAAIGFSYQKIFLLVRHHRRQIQSQQAAVSADHASQTKLAITMGYVIGVSMVCYLPTVVVSEVFMAIDQPNEPFFSVVLLTLAIQLTSSSFNPIVYCWRRQDIRRPIIVMLQSSYKCCGNAF